MSGFDFDALRDPDAPQPGPRERAGVDARARRLRARARMNRLALSSVSVVAVVVLAFGIVASQRDDGPKVLVGNPTGPAGSGARFIPPTTTKDGIVTMPVTLPDGETFTVRYPEAMRIADLGYSGGIQLDWPPRHGGSTCCTYAELDYATVAQHYGDARPLRVYPGRGGDPVGLYRIPVTGAPPQGLAPTQELAFQFGQWLVRVPLTVNPGGTELATFARSLSGTVDENGYPVLSAEAPLAIGHMSSGGFPALSPPRAGNSFTFDSYISCGHLLSPWSTPQLIRNGKRQTVAWCVNKTLSVSFNGTPQFRDDALHQVEITPLEQPSGSTSITVPGVTTPTTSTTRPSPAVAASFVSVDRGWVLEASGAIVTTRDGGRTWEPLATLGRSGSDYTIRFADADHGFAFARGGGSAVLVTEDGGNSWSPARQPFSSVYDLAISRGFVYVVSFKSGDQPAFRIWSSPVGGTLRWTEDPLVIPPGAGPVPTMQFVFSGDRGWLVQVDRVVVNGARMASDGSWTAWTPPCANAGGAAFLAASSPNDLVASCEEGAYTGPRVTHGIYFSHDGGRVFTRHAAPESGLVATPNRATAIVPGTAGVERTGDSGATWHGVFDAPLNAVDLGFTTPTQGFIVLSNGTMLMTYDAGATWQKVTLP